MRSIPLLLSLCVAGPAVAQDLHIAKTGEAVPTRTADPQTGKVDSCGLTVATTTAILMAGVTSYGVGFRGTVSIHWIKGKLYGSTKGALTRTTITDDAVADQKLFPLRNWSIKAEGEPAAEKLAALMPSDPPYQLMLTDANASLAVLEAIAMNRKVAITMESDDEPPLTLNAAMSMKNSDRRVLVECQKELLARAQTEPR